MDWLVSHWMGDQKCIISSSSVLWKACKAVGLGCICSRQHPPIHIGLAWWVLARSPYVIHKEGLCPSSGDINRLTMMMMKLSKAGTMGTSQF
jgi:hypothetical protein